MVKNKAALLSNSVDVAMESPVDDETSLGKFKRKWKAVHASKFDVDQGPVKNVKLTVNGTNFVGEAVPYTFIQQLRIGGVGTAPDLTNYIQKNVDVDISSVYTFDKGKLVIKSAEGVNDEVVSKSDLTWSKVTGKPTLF
jgi:hypothetical protein